MTQKEKDLLIKDLCARLPYNVWVEYKGKYYIVSGIVHGRLTLLTSPVSSIGFDEHPLIEEVKPCLFSLSSMTEEQRKEYHELLCNPENGIDIDYFDWCHQNHFDCRHLIPMGLANDATGLNIY